MATDTLVRMTYWGGWISAGVALLYKFFFTVGVGTTLALQSQVFPRHFWQMSFLLFLICIATDACARRKSA